MFSRSTLSLIREPCVPLCSLYTYIDHENSKMRNNLWKDITHKRQFSDYKLNLVMEDTELSNFTRESHHGSLNFNNSKVYGLSDKTIPGKRFSYKQSHILNICGIMGIGAAAYSMYSFLKKESLEVK